MWKVKSALQIIVLSTATIWLFVSGILLPLWLWRKDLGGIDLPKYIPVSYDHHPPFSFANVDWFFLAGVILGICILSAAWSVKEDFSADMPTVLKAFLAGCGLVAGIKVCLLAIALPQSLSMFDQGGIFVGGIALICISVDEGKSLIFTKPKT